MPLVVLRTPIVGVIVIDGTPLLFVFRIPPLVVANPVIVLAPFEYNKLLAA